MTLTLWHARTKFKADGKWLPKHKLYDVDNPKLDKQPQYHLLYNTPLEAYLSLHEKINNFYAHDLGSLFIFIYTAKVCLIRKNNHIKPEEVNNLGLIQHSEFIPTHLIRQSVIFQRQANLEIQSRKYWDRKSKDNVFDLHYLDEEKQEKFFMPLSQIQVNYNRDTWSKYQIETITDLFDIKEANLARDFRLAEHNPSNLQVFKNVEKYSLGR